MNTDRLPVEAVFHNAYGPDKPWFYDARLAAGYSPSVRLFEAAACGTPIITDVWPGLETFFTPGKEVLIGHSTVEMLHLLRETPRGVAIAIGKAARAKVLSRHTAAHRAEELERYLGEVTGATSMAVERFRPPTLAESRGCRRDAAVGRPAGRGPPGARNVPL